ncbi:hypothetical protein J532_3837 [Acinetobacter baumannii 940793]|nr:hypothetical protein J659_3994 [Acinetobacter baumannii 1406589]EYT36782.1 hypothetical protein J497_03135 [Acinetobacter baumannii 1121032]KCX12670.1 hypothetical protein J990_0854 [Acinetobacter baumannii 45075_4]KCX81796.1 hypothetical protein J532_3837 [Acinetobacter baumannii 940793]
MSGTFLLVGEMIMHKCIILCNSGLCIFALFFAKKYLLKSRQLKIQII